jgi:hypothetical protein
VRAKPVLSSRATPRHEKGPRHNNYTNINYRRICGNSNNLACPI